MNSANPADQLREAMQNAARSHGAGETGNLGPDGLAMHPGAGSAACRSSPIRRAWTSATGCSAGTGRPSTPGIPLIPDEVNPPIYKSGAVAIRFKVLPNGRLMDGSLVLEGRSGDMALDRAAWGALTGSNYPPLPQGVPRPVPGAARLLPLQHGSAEVEQGAAV